jgi:hypothetical protein
MIDPEATERFMAAPWLGELAPDEKRASSPLWSKRGPRLAPCCSDRISPTTI